MLFFQQSRRRLSTLQSTNRNILHEHKKWTHPHHFMLMLCLSSSMIQEASNFPIRFFEFGKLNFFIIYAILFFVFGIPMVILECQLGQYFGQSSLNVIRHMCPLAGGIGIVQLVAMFTCLIKSHLKLSVFINYVFSALVFTSPWQICGHAWSKINCFTKHQNDKCLLNNKYFWNNTCTEAKAFCNAFKMKYENDTYCSFMNEHKFIPHLLRANTSSPGKDYFFYMVASKYHGEIFDFYFFSNCTLAWTISLICLCKGLNKTGVQVAHFLFLVSNFILLFLVITTLMFSGGIQGVLYGFDFDMKALVNVNNWITAMVEVITTLNIGFGTNPMLASFNHFNAQLIPSVFYSGCCVIVLDQFLYSLFIYALWGVSSVKSHRELPEISQEYHPSRLAILAMMPDLVKRHSTPRFWAIMFLTSAVCKIIGNNLIVLETISISLSDVSVFCSQRPRTTRTTVAIVGMLLSFLVPFMLPVYFVREFYSFVSFDIELLALAELLIFTLMYGFVSNQKYRQFWDLQEMFGLQTEVYRCLRIAYYFVAPAFIVLYVVLKVATINLDASNDYLLILVTVYLAKTPIILLVHGARILLTAYCKRQPLGSTVIPTDYWMPQQQISFKTKYKPKSPLGTWKYKFALLANQMGFEV